MPSSNRRIIKLALKGLLASTVLCFIAVAVAMFHLTFQIEKRFSGKRWNIPSRVYSDTTPLFPGQTINRDSFLMKLANLGYKRVETTLSEKGTFTETPQKISFFLKDTFLKHFDRRGFPISIYLDENLITSIQQNETGKMIDYLELEPEELMLFFGPEREKRLLVSINQVPLYLQHAVISAEDRKFYTHFGIDPSGMLRALYKNLKEGKVKQGGSTLTQQLAKNYFLTPERTIIRKIKEILISLIIEGLYEKNEILEIYLNEIYFGQNGSVAINGIGEASYFYFGKDVSQLSIDESAILAGLIKAPNLYSPYANITRCKKRRDQVLRSMMENGWLSDGELERSLNIPVTSLGYRRYGKKAPYFMDYLAHQLEKLYAPETLKNDGLSILTTLDTQVQTVTENALENGLHRIEASIPALKKDNPLEKLQGVVIVMQPRTGNIIAMVGGRDYSISQFNRAVYAERQPGSAFKPFVFLSALDYFYPSTILNNTELSYTIDGETWSPKNYSDKFPSSVSMRQALAFSLNLATVDLAIKTGIQHILDTSHLFGFSTRFDAYPSLALGAYEVIPLELATAYCVFAADGVLPCPLSVRKVMDANGTVIERQHMEIKSITSPEKSFLISSMLETAVKEGTGKSLNGCGISFPVAGKTGTTNNSRDAWFVGYTPDILALVWVGFDNGDSLLSTGAYAALPIWAELIRNIPQYISGKNFKIPEGIEKIVVCRDSGLPANKNSCIKTEEEVFLKENVPKKHCPLHKQKGMIDNLLDRIKQIIQ
ncbi:MAG: PBP1A family penicillin-binding protein [Proteobacteria bacterium]|nr:PBP1A family penicillin-binding protein [Pseudomonadota bacterium]